MWWKKKPVVVFVDGRLTGAVISRTATVDRRCFDPFSVVYYSDLLCNAAMFAPHELTDQTIQLRGAWYYDGQVTNGGHSQFVRNSGSELQGIIAKTLAALEAMGAEAQRQTLLDLRTWVGANPDEASRQTGFDVRAEYLDTLDKRFFAAAKDDSIPDMAGRWVARWPNLEIVDEKRYFEPLKRLVAANPWFDIRRIWSAVESNRKKLSDPLHIGVAAACGAVIPEPDVKISINAGSYFEQDGKTVCKWGVSTSNGTRYAVCDETGCKLYEFVDWQSGQQLGKQIAGVSPATVQQFTTVAEQTNAPAAIDLVMRRAGWKAGEYYNPELTAWKLGSERATWMAHSGERTYVIETAPDGSALLDPFGKPVLSLSKDEIAAHYADALRGRDSLVPKV